MTTAVIYGSHRSNRQGIKAAKFIVNQINAEGNEAILVDAKAYDLPFLDKMYKEYEEGQAPESLEQVAQILKKADGFMIVSGEYNHSIPASLKNLLDYFQSEYFFKPAGIACYSAGTFGGVRVAVHLRAVLGELGMVTLPSLFPISKVQDSFDENGNAIDKAYEKRIKKFLSEYNWYCEALQKKRTEGTPY